MTHLRPRIPQPSTACEIVFAFVAGFVSALMLAGFIWGWW